MVRGPSSKQARLRFEEPKPERHKRGLVRGGLVWLSDHRWAELDYRPKQAKLIVQPAKWVRFLDRLPGLLGDHRPWRFAGELYLPERDRVDLQFAGTALVRPGDPNYADDWQDGDPWFALSLNFSGPTLDFAWKYQVAGRKRTGPDNHARGYLAMEHADDPVQAFAALASRREYGELPPTVRAGLGYQWKETT